LQEKQPDFGLVRPIDTVEVEPTDISKIEYTDAIWKTFPIQDSYKHLPQYLKEQFYGDLSGKGYESGPGTTIQQDYCFGKGPWRVLLLQELDEKVYATVIFTKSDVNLRDPITKFDYNDSAREQAIPAGSKALILIEMENPGHCRYSSVAGLTEIQYIQTAIVSAELESIKNFATRYGIDRFIKWSN